MNPSTVQCQYCYDRGYFFYFGRGIGNALGPCYHLKCKHCGGRYADEHVLVSAPVKNDEKSAVEAEEDF